MIHVYYGFGKGKTTCAIGCGVRAASAGMNVLLVQFLKDNKSSELKLLPFDIFKSPSELPFNPDDSYKEWVNDAVEYVRKSNADMIILDEFLDIIPRYLSLNDAVNLLNKNCEIIITGHSVINSIFDKADYITHMKKERHPFDSGVKARKGIEY